ncbi:phosphonate ABC transporter, permease protein PhnE [Rhizobium sullae]|uniref:Phosphonate ABC transporter, permease protein PhnE n=1 Tax=Rhizobium sullae TaxID=50338 RepID=A0A2N0DCZ8_RHISU|nr:phosphonate ABC transporter, permease protein PhnE [Rhizobium sullae]PKA43962.1 phosphonate ABC transporter, permease protein PhnE [Rhizobium sullae]
MTTLSPVQKADIAARHPELFGTTSLRRYRAPLLVILAAGYVVFSFWFFAFGKVFSQADYSIAGTYLADWISFEVRPEIDMAADGTMKISYSRFDPLGEHPNPNWVQAEKSVVTHQIGTTSASAVSPSQPQTRPKSSMSLMAPGSALGSSAPPGSGSPAQAPAVAAPTTVTEEVVTRARVAMSSSSSIEMTANKAVLTRGGATVVVPMGGPDIRIDAPLPDWASQRRPGEKIIASFGFAGWAEVTTNDVKIHKRFLGWANFLFDTRSPFFSKPSSEIASLVLGGPRIDPERSNLALAWDNILYNSEWQHLDVWTKLLQTIVMAFVGTLFASLIAFPLAFVAARNITRNRFANQVTKRFFDFQRSVDMLIWALFFTRGFGPGPLAGISAIFFTDTGTLGKLYSESLENIDEKQREGVRSVGASPMAVQRFGVLPQVLPVFASQALYFWESNTRSATIIGAVGAGGIGLKLWEAMRTNQDWENVAYMVILILIVVFLFDAASNALRQRLMGTKAH